MPVAPSTIAVMPFLIRTFETTPNPNAVKCILDRPISQGPRSFLSAGAADADPLAKALFAVDGVTCILMNGGWMTVNKRPETSWPAVKAGVKQVLHEAP
jgi:NFU1 iron-sulfur cluster scaffold homolog, mitochondrial